MLLFFILIFFLLFISIKIKVEINNLYIDTEAEEKLDRKYDISFVFKVLGLIPISKIILNDKKIKKIIGNKKITDSIKRNRISLNKEDLKKLKDIKIDVSKFKLDLKIGTSDAAITAILIPIVSTFISLFLRNKIKRFDGNNKMQIMPLYKNKNLLKIRFSGIFNIKMIHIIITICKLGKKRRVDKNEQSSNRGSYDYGYE